MDPCFFKNDNLELNTYPVQYKIPVQIENEDPIILWLSLKQLGIIMIWWAIAYSIFKWLAPSAWPEVAAIPSVLVAIIAIIIAIFKHSEMTFIPYILNLIRLSINSEPKIWKKWVDSFQPIDIWYVTKSSEKKEKEVDTTMKIDKINELSEKLKNI